MNTSASLADSTTGERRPGSTASPPLRVAVFGYSGQVGTQLLERLDQAGTGLLLSERINRQRHAYRDQCGWHDGPKTADSLMALERRLGCGIGASGNGAALIVDCTADPALPDHYPDWLAQGIGVVAANKHGLAGPESRYRRMQRAAKLAPLLYSATVGAGLPIISSLRHARLVGTRLLELQAILSGTLSHVLGLMNQGTNLSAAVQVAQGMGLTEPDPLQDLSGRDVARKLGILLREAGLAEVEIEREPLIPDEWAAARSLSELKDWDAIWQERVSQARERGEWWVYRAEFNGHRAMVRPICVPGSDALASIRGPGNMVRFRLDHDPTQELVISGPGAGVSVTSAAVMADILIAAERLRDGHADFDRAGP